MNIIIGADLVPTKSNIDLFAAGNVQALLGRELEEILKGADYRIFNLEVPLADTQSPIPKCGPALIAPAKSISGYQVMGVDLLTLANNHILDQDQQGLESTIRTLEQAGIAYVGVGSTPEEAAKPYIFECDGKKIGVYACVEHECSVVTGNSAGANPIDLLESPDHVAALKARCDYVIVLYHGGKEHYRYPSPNLQKVCRKLVEKGADLVVCQHSHCIGCEEKYLHGTIVYGQGNFLFDHKDSVYWQTGLLIQISEDFQIRYIPLKKQENGVRVAQGEAEEWILREFRERSAEMADPEKLQARYREFACGYLSDFLSIASGKRYGIFIKMLNKLSGRKLIPWLNKRRYKGGRWLTLQNRIECEANYEIFVTGLREGKD